MTRTPTEHFYEVEQTVDSSRNFSLLFEDGSNSRDNMTSATPMESSAQMFLDQVAGVAILRRSRDFEESSKHMHEHGVLQISFNRLVAFSGINHYPISKEQLEKQFIDYLQSDLQAITFSKIISRLHLKGFPESAARINELRQMDDDDFEEGDKPLSVESARGFAKFITRFACLGEPGLGLFSTGTLSAGWKVAENKHLLLEFFDDNNLCFAMIKPDESNPDGKFRLNGNGSQEAVLRTLEESGVMKWRE